MPIKNLYKVISSNATESGISVDIRIDKNNPIFKVHFPEHPIMPGVCMMQIVKELTEETIGRKLRMSKASNVKFLALINPEVHPDITLDIAITEVDDEVKVKNISSFENTVALKMGAAYKII